MKSRETYDLLPISVAALAPTPVEDLAERIDAARAAQVPWMSVPFTQRRRHLRRVVRRLLANADLLAETVAHETGFLRDDVFALDILPTAALLDVYAPVMEELLEPLERDVSLPQLWRGGAERTCYVARGVVGVITSAASPVMAPFRAMVTALLAGNAVLVKTSAATPQTAALLVSFFERWIPSGLVTLLQGDDATGRALVAAEVDALWFRGEERTGRWIAAACAERGCPVVLSPVVQGLALVAADASLPDAAASLTAAAFAHGGRSPGALLCAYVERAVAEAFVEEVIARARVQSQRLSPEVPDARRWTEPMQTRIEQALRDSGELVWGELPQATATVAEAPSKRSPLVVRLDGVAAATTPLIADPVTYPVVTVVVVDDLDAAVTWINARHSRRPLSVWTASTRRGEVLAARTGADVVTVNAYPLGDFQLPKNALDPWAVLPQEAALAGILLRPQRVTVARPGWLAADDRKGASSDLVRWRAQAIWAGGGHVLERVAAGVTLLRIWLQRLTRSAG